MKWCVIFLLILRVAAGSIELTDSEPYADEIIGGEWHYFHISMPTTWTEPPDVTIVLEVELGDIDVYISKTSTSPSSFFSTWQGFDSTGELVFISRDDPNNGLDTGRTYYIGVHGYSSGQYPSVYTITVYLEEEIKEMHPDHRVPFDAFIQSCCSGSWCNWDDPDKDPCYWQGIHCDVDGFVRSISLPFAGIACVFPEELTQLETLEELVIFADGGLTGAIPESIGNMTNLRVLDLSFQGITSIPESICTLGRLDTLRLANNDIVGTIPWCIGDLEELHVLDLSGNNLYGPIPAGLANASKLRVIVLHEMELSGSIPSELGNLEHIEIFDVHENALTGEWPKFFIENSPIAWLFVGKNQLTGTLDGVTNWANSKVQYLRLEYNQISGSIPSELFLIPDLYDLGLESNLLTGPLPELITYSPVNLVFMDQNTLEGPIPDSWMRNMNPRQLSLFQNNLSGVFPDQLFGFWSELYWMDVTDNHFSGPLPSTFCGANYISHFSAGNNKFNGTLEFGARDCLSLDVFLVPNNEFWGTIPELFNGQRTSIDVWDSGVDLSGNNWACPWPSWMTASGTALPEGLTCTTVPSISRVSFGVGNSTLISVIGEGFSSDAPGLSCYLSNDDGESEVIPAEYVDSNAVVCDTAQASISYFDHVGVANAGEDFSALLTVDGGGGGGNKKWALPVALVIILCFIILLCVIYRHKLCPNLMNKSGHYRLEEQWAGSMVDPPPLTIPSLNAPPPAGEEASYPPTSMQLTSMQPASVYQDQGQDFQPQNTQIPSDSWTPAAAPPPAPAPTTSETVAGGFAPQRNPYASPPTI